MDKRVLLCLVGALALMAGGPIAGYAYIVYHAQEAYAAGELMELSVNGLLIVGATWLLGIAGLVHLAVCVHSKPESIVATNGSVACSGDLNAPVTITSERPVNRRIAISAAFWAEMMAWAAEDDDVKAITERYDLVNDYELVDAAPGATLPDGRWVMDIGVSFMYPHGARAASVAATSETTA